MNGGWYYEPPHAVSVRVEPALPVALLRKAAAEFDPPGQGQGPPTVVEMATPHGFVVGDTVRLAGTTSTPDLNGDHAVLAVNATMFAIEDDITSGGAGGTVQRVAAVEPLTVEQGKLLAGLDWTAGDPRDALMAGYIRAARTQVELDTGRAVLSQMRDVRYDVLPAYGAGGAIALPMLCIPLQAIVSISVANPDGTVYVIPPTDYLVDLTSGRFALTGSAPASARPFQPWTVRVVAGAAQIADIPSNLMQAIGLLTAHWATAGRDLAAIGTIVATMPLGYDDAIWPSRPVVL